MRISYRWLKEYVDFDLDARRLADAFTFRCTPVEGVELLPTGDARLTLEVTFNRPDLLSHLGVAQEVAAIVDRPVRRPEVARLPPAGGAGAASAATAVEVLAPALCPRYTARVVEGVKIGPSPAWLQARLDSIGVRPVNNVVDVTNFVLHEWGQPLHAFDLATLAERRIVVRTARAGEAIRTIDGRDRPLDEETLVIADARRPVAVAGVMGGAETEVTERTRDVLLESAYFDPIAIRRAVRRLGLTSDSSHRFERGVDPAGVDAASRRAAALIVEVAGGELCEGLVDVARGPMPTPRHVSLRLDRLRRLAGVDISRKQAARALAALGFGVVETETTLEVTVPTARAEAAREVDLIEEVLRSFGYDRVPLNPAFPARVAPKDPRERAIAAVQALLAGAGYREVHTLSFVEDDPVLDPPLFAERPPHRVRNPVRPETPCLRRSLFGSVLKVRKLNEDRGNRRTRLFEISTVYLPRQDEQPDERLHLAMLADPEAGFRGLKGDVEAVLGRLSVLSRVRFGRVRTPALDGLEAAEIALDSQRLGYIGKVGRAAAERVDLRERPYVAVLDLERLLALGSLERKVEALPTFPAVTRDVAAVVEARVYWQEVLDALAPVDVPDLARVTFLSAYEGDPIPAGKKSVAFSLEFRAADRTLTGEEADRGREAVKRVLAERFGASFRE